MKAAAPRAGSSPRNAPASPLTDACILAVCCCVIPATRFSSRSSWVASALIRTTSSSIVAIVLNHPAEFGYVVFGERAGAGRAVTARARPHHVPGGGPPELRRLPAEDAEADFLVGFPGEAVSSPPVNSPISFAFC